MNRANIFKWLLISVLTIQAGYARAVCLGPNGVSGYHEPLEEELARSVAVIVGEAVKESTLQEDLSDPDGITATVYRVRVLTVLRGDVAKEIDIRDENDSGRFGFQLGKQYVLLIGRHGADWIPESAKNTYFVSSCGSSGLLSERSNVLGRLTLHTATDSKAIQAIKPSSTPIKEPAP